MADKLNSGNIYTNAVGNNLVVVDPNKVVLNGEIKDRLVDHEDMVMYANLTAIIYPRSKVISGSQIILNPRILGFKTVAFIGIYLDKAIRNPEAVKQLKNIPEVIECHYTTGNWSIFTKLLCRDNEHLMELLNKKIQSIDGVSRTETFISLQEQINRQIKFQ